MLLNDYAYDMHLSSPGWGIFYSQLAQGLCISLLVVSRHTSSINEGHQGVITDRRHSLKRGDRLSKKRQLLTGKKRQIAICVMVKK